LLVLITCLYHNARFKKRKIQNCPGLQTVRCHRTSPLHTLPEYSLTHPHMSAYLPSNPLLVRTQVLISHPHPTKIKAHLLARHEGVWGNKAMAPHFRNFGTGWG